MATSNIWPLPVVKHIVFKRVSLTDLSRDWVFIDVLFALFYVCLDEMKLFVYNKRKLPLHQYDRKKVLNCNSLFFCLFKGRTYQKWLQYASNHKKPG